MAAIIDDFVLDDALVVKVVDRVAVAVVVVMVAVLDVVAPLAFPLDFAGTLLARRADPIGQVYEALDVVLFLVG
jgi:hypothetical protein